MVVRRVVSNPWFKAVATLLIIGLLVFWLRDQMPFLARGFHMMGDLDRGWVALALVFAFLSMSSYASVQKLLLRSAGVVVGYWNSLGLILASNAISTSIPGGQVFGAALTYRRTRQWGASAVIASWQLVVSGILATAGIVLLALLGFFLVGRGTNPALLALSAIGLLASVFVIQWAARHPDRIEGVVLGCLARVNRRRRRHWDAGAGRVRDIVRQVEVVELSPRQLSRAFGWSLLNWVGDIGCLWAASMAVGAEHSVGGLAIAYVAGKIVATAPVTPGGLGTVEFALVTALTAGGLDANVAFATVFIYRIVSFVLVALVGWVVFGCFYRNIADPAPGPGSCSGAGAGDPGSGAGDPCSGSEAGAARSAASAASAVPARSAASAASADPARSPVPSRTTASRTVAPSRSVTASRSAVPPRASS